MLKVSTKGGNQGGNQGGNFMKQVPTLFNAINNNGLQLSEVWLSVKESSYLLGVTDRAVKKQCKAKKYFTELVQGNGGLQYRISLSSLPMEVQIRWRKEHGFAPEKVSEDVEKTCREFDEMSEQQRQTALDRYDLVVRYREVVSRARRGALLAEKERFIARYEGGEWPVLLEKLGSVHWKTIDRWISVLAEHEGRPSSLAPNYRYTRDGASVVGVSMAQGQMILSYFMHGSQPKISEVVRKVNRRLQQVGMEQVTESRVRRFLKQHNVNHEAQVVMAREGEKAYNDKCAPYIKRNVSLLLPGDVMVSDGHKIAFPIQHPVSGKPVRMSLIAHQDLRTRALLGWEIMPTENTAAIAASLRRSMLWLGRLVSGVDDMAFVPRVMNIDNGKAYKSHFFNGLKGKTMVDVGGVGLYDQLMPYGFAGVAYSKAYNGQEKIIERTWRELAELERSVPNYTGTSIAMKPAHLRRGEYMHREIAEMLSLNTAPTIAEAHYLIALWAHEYNLRPQGKSSLLKGLCPYEALKIGLDTLKDVEGEAISNRFISRDTLMFLMMAQTTRTLKRNGISLFGRQYLSAELHDLAKGQREFVVRYDFDRLDSVAIYHPNGEFVCFAEEFCPNGGVHPAAKLLGSADDVAAYKEAAKLKNGLHRATRKEVKQVLLGAAEAGFTQLVQDEVLPDVIRKQVKAAEAVAEERRLTGTDGGELGESERERMRRRLTAANLAQLDAMDEF